MSDYELDWITPVLVRLSPGPVTWKYCLAVAVLCALLEPANAQLENVELRLVDGSKVACVVDEINSQGQIRGTGLPDGIHLGQVLELRTGRRINRSATGSRLLLADGSVIMATSPNADGDTIAFNSNLGLSQLRLEQMRAFVWNETPLVRKAMQNRSPDNDQVIVKTKKGERLVEGLIEGIDETHVSINYKSRTRRISLDIVQAIVSADLGLAKQEGALGDFSLTDGSVLAGLLLKLGHNSAQFRLGNTVVDIPTSLLAKMKWRSDNLVYLSDLEPVTVQERSLFGIQRSWQRDRNIKGYPLTLGKPGESVTRYEKGLGTQSYCELVFLNENNFDRFRAIVGIDLKTGGRGDCQMSVEGDGVRLWSQRVKGAQAPLPVSVDISGSKRISLIVDPGEEFDLSDHANWAEARFTKSK